MFGLFRIATVRCWIYSLCPTVSSVLRWLRECNLLYLVARRLESGARDSNINVRFITNPFSKVMGLARHRKHEKRLQRQLRDVRTLCVRIPRQNIVVNVSRGLSVTVLPESLDLELLVCSV